MITKNVSNITWYLSVWYNFLVYINQNSMKKEKMIKISTKINIWEKSFSFSFFVFFFCKILWHVITVWSNESRDATEGQVELTAFFTLFNSYRKFAYHVIYTSLCWRGILLGYIMPSVMSFVISAPDYSCWNVWARRLWPASCTSW